MRRVREIVRTAVIATNAVQCAERRALCVTAYRDEQSEEWCAEDKGWDKQCAERTARHKVPPQIRLISYYWCPVKVAVAGTPCLTPVA